MKEPLSNESISIILQKGYETRTSLEHRTLSHLISSTLPNCSLEMGKKLSCFVQELAVQQQPPLGSILLIRTDQTTQQFKYIVYQQHSTILNILTPSSFALVISQRAMRKCEVIGSIEQEVKNLQANEYFEEVPKKRLYSVLKQAEVVILSYGELLLEGQNNKHDVFFSRKGEFSYEIKDPEQDKSIQIFTFQQGHLFSKVPFDSHQQEISRHSSPQTKSYFGVRCKSSKGVFYRFNREFFISYLLFYCESSLKQNTERLNTLLKERSQHVKQVRKPKTNLLTQKIQRSLSVSLQPLRDKMASTARKGPVRRQSSPPINMSDKPQDYRMLKQEQPPRNKLYSKGELAKLTLNPQQSESDVLLWKRSRCQRVKELTHPSRVPLSRAETMLQFIKFTVHFEKTRRKPSIF